MLQASCGGRSLVETRQAVKDGGGLQTHTSEDSSCKHTVCVYRDKDHKGRRGVLANVAVAAMLLEFGGKGAFLNTKESIAKSNLSSIQKNQQQQQLITFITKKLKDSGFGEADLQKLMTLLVSDAATYNTQTKDGGVNGDVLSLTTDIKGKGFLDIVDRLKLVKQDIDATSGTSPVSYADLLVVSAKLAITQTW